MVSSSPAAPAAARSKFTPQQRKAIVAGTIGNAVEWVDWSLYSIFVTFISAAFFPKSEGPAALLSTLVVFAVGFVMRPVGAAILGAYADRHGRKKGLTLTIGLMSVAAFVMALCPGYATIGIAAPIVLLLARLVQGFSAGGEFGSSSAFLVESASKGRRAFAGSWQQVSVGAGVVISSLLGTILTSTLSDDALQAWGWRLAFAVGGLLGLVGLWLRISVEETESFTTAQTAGTRRSNPVKAMFRDHPRAALRVVGITIAGTLTYYIWINYLPTYAHVTTGIPLNEALLSQTICSAIFIILLPFAGMLSDKIGRKKTMGAFALCFVLFSFPLLNLLGASFWSVFIVQLIGCVFLLGYSANCAVIMAEQFPPEVRATGIALPYAIAVALFGGTAPYITTWMSGNGLTHLVWLYVSIAAAISFVVYVMMPETSKKEFV